MTDTDTQAINRLSTPSLADWSAKGLAVLIILLLAYSDLAMEKMIAISDYTTSFYTSSRLVMEHRLSELYPSASDTTLANTDYDKAAHRFLPNLPATMTAIFPYSPVVALLLCPLSLLPPNIALLLFQALCLGALALSSNWLRQTEDHEHPNLPGQSLFFSCFLFTPIVLTLWIGQLGILLGLFVFAAGYYLLRKERPLLAGCVWSLTLLKPQFALMPGVVALVLLFVKRWKLTAGMAIGATLLAAANFLFFGPQLVQSWLGAMKLTEAVYLSPTSGVARHIAVSVPRLILFTVPYESIGQFRLLVYALSALLLALTVFVCYRFARRSNDERAAIGAGVLAGSLMIPLVAPHLFYYDLCVLFFGGCTIASSMLPSELRRQLTRSAVAVWLIISLYPFLFIISKSMYLPLVILLPLTAVFVQLLRLLWLAPPADSCATPH